MPTPWPFALLASLVLAWCGAARAAEETPAPLLGYCAPPFVPPCLDQLRAKPELVKTCAPQAEAYEATVFAYRVCLNRETERAVREANVAMAKLRCAQGRRGC